jgi:hypothetical protein
MTGTPAALPADMQLHSMAITQLQLLQTIVMNTKARQWLPNGTLQLKLYD